MAASEGIALKRKQLVASALSKHLSLDPEACLGNTGESDGIKALCSKILKSPSGQTEEVMKWIAFSDGFPLDSKACLDALVQLNTDLLTKSVLLGTGTTPSEADVVVFAVVHSCVIGLSHSERKKLPHLLRWIDYIQHKEEFAELFEKIVLEKPVFEPCGKNTFSKPEVDSNTKKTSTNTENAEKSEADSNVKKSDVTKKSTGAKESTQEKKKTSEKEAVEKDELSVSLLNIQVGLIQKAWKHPSADSLLVEEIDVGEAKLRQVVSGLAKFCTPEELTNRRVVLITNVKPGKLRDVMSEGLVLCASSEDHTVVEPLLPPEGAKIGERVTFAGVDGKPEDVLNPKKKQLEKITPHLFTDDKGVATFKGIPFMTSGGPCRSLISKASIK